MIIVVRAFMVWVRSRRGFSLAPPSCQPCEGTVRRRHRSILSQLDALNAPSELLGLPPEQETGLQLSREANVLHSELRGPGPSPKLPSPRPRPRPLPRWHSSTPTPAPVAERDPSETQTQTRMLPGVGASDFPRPHATWQQTTSHACVRTSAARHLGLTVAVPNPIPRTQSHRFRYRDG